MLKKGRVQKKEQGVKEPPWSYVNKIIIRKSI